MEVPATVSFGWVFWCRRHSYFVTNPLSQKWQRKDFSPVCNLFSCDTRSLRLRNVVLQNRQLKGFSPVWNLLWKTCDFLERNLFSQCWHLYGFSPVWISSWLVHKLFSVKALLQYWQLKGLSPVWILSCVVHWLLLKKHFHNIDTGNSVHAFEYEPFHGWYNLFWWQTFFHSVCICKVFQLCGS